LSELRVIKMHG